MSTRSQFDYPAPFGDMLHDELRRRALDRPPPEGFTIGVLWGAGWAFAIIGMAEAIRAGVRDGRFSQEGWEYIGDGRWVQY